MAAAGNPKGIAIIQPRVGAQRLPWVNVPKNHNPERVASIPHIPFVKFDFITCQQLPELSLK